MPPLAGHASGVRGAVEFARSVRRITAERLADLQHFPDLILFMAASATGESDNLPFRSSCQVRATTFRFAQAVR
jgi:hypothetical protein